jgi:tetratricopeptide (TPR) repeat protein
MAASGLWLLLRPKVDGEKLLQAQREHRAAIELYLQKDRKGGDEGARRALRLYEEAGALTADLSDLHYEAIVTLAEDDRYDQAIEETLPWLDRFPGDRLHRETLAKLYFQSGRLSDAAKELLQLLRRAGEDPRLLKMAIDVKTLEGSQAEALALLERYIKAANVSRPASGSSQAGVEEGLRLVTRVYLRFQEDEKALPYLERLHDLLPQDRSVQLDLGSALRKLGRQEEARLLLEPLRDDPGLGNEALHEMAVSYAKEARYQEAVGALCDLLERDPANAPAYHQLSMALERTGKKPEAERMEKAAKALSQSQREKARSAEYRAAGRAADAALARAQSFSLAGRFREADGALQEPRFRRNPYSSFQRARLYLDWLRASEAAEILLELKNADGGSHPEVGIALAMAIELQGSREKPGDLRQRIAQAPWPEAALPWIELARSAELSREDAVRAARLGCAADPSLAEGWRALAQLLTYPEEVFYRLEAWKALLKLQPGAADGRDGEDACRREIQALRADR